MRSGAGTHAGKNRGSYDEYYERGGWTYNYDEERRDLHRVVTAIGLSKGARVLEIGCGMGFHSKILHDLGFRVTGNDLSEVAMAHARAHHRGPTWVGGDTTVLAETQWKDGSFDAIVCRGHSWFHYELDGPNRKGFNPVALTKRLFELLTSDGVFILTIRTNFTGTVCEDGVLNNLYDSYVNLFRGLGNIVYIADTKGRLLFTSEAAVRSGHSIMIATRKEPVSTFASFDRAIPPWKPFSPAGVLRNTLRKVPLARRLVQIARSVTRRE